MMNINRGYNPDTTTGDRQIIYCEAGNGAIDEIFYRTILGINANNFQFKPLGSSNILLSYAKTGLIENGFCLIDRDFRTEENTQKLEDKYSIKFLKSHEVEYFLLNIEYLKQLDYVRPNINIQQKLDQVIKEKEVRFLADFLQFKINACLGIFPRISKLRGNQLPKKEEVVELLFTNLDNNYQTVKDKIQGIKNHYINLWVEEFETLTLKELPAKEIFKTLKSRIFINQHPKESDIAKDIALLMEQDNYLPEELREIFTF